MIRLIRRTRGFAIAAAVLALTASAALAGRSALSTPTAATDGLARAAAAAGKTVPVAAQPESAPTADEDTDVDENEPAEDPADDSGVHPDNHGKLVSEAAKGATPEAFDNHGAYVKSVATVNHGLDPDAERGASQTKKPSR